jgi:phage terminase Nu1 subunit (DNA packaging protein)
MSRIIEPYYLTAKELGQILGVSGRTIETWADKEFLLRSNNRQGFDLVTGAGYRISDLTEKIEKAKNNSEDGKRLYVAQCRKTEAEASVKELELEEKKGNLIPINEAVNEIKDAFVRVRARMVAIPTRLAPELAGITDPQQVAARLQSVIDEALNELSTTFLEQEHDGPVTE